MADYKAVLIEKGPGGWGGPLTILPTDEKPLIYCVTGGGIHPTSPAGPLAMFITEDLMVSGVKADNIKPID